MLIQGKKPGNRLKGGTGTMEAAVTRNIAPDVTDHRTDSCKGRPIVRKRPVTFLRLAGSVPYKYGVTDYNSG